MLCALCKNIEADKKNTHFLTDSVIRTCLNENGENIREKGLYFDISNENPFVEFNFQRRTTFEKLNTILGRQPDDLEIEKAKQIPFSVDFVFCSNCEKKFSEIEESFTKKYLKDFRNNQYTGNLKSINDYKLIKLFFLLQVWRTSICDSIFTIDEEVSEKLRLIFLNKEEIEPEVLNEFPISVTYLITEHNDDANKANFVGYTDDKNPNLIFMNDFIIQFYNNYDSIRFFDFYGLNDKTDYTNYLNLDTQAFIFKLFTAEQRINLLNEFILGDKIRALIDFYSENFARLWFSLFGNYPQISLIQSYLSFITNGSEKNLLHYTKDNIFKLTSKFIEKQLK
ncbi:hypothetical protein [Draconibacterium halophilum]|uniref:Uncharacterized protein n=1 Tax=Draconibacterium halophilum TaxID=2706887 RepID=A0A6C0RG77_9BACT|nr:hypothetical protein [Draconibacterium halophilum]QIA08832.1 hypothetical protein G0Q07_14375 [Draconibacterium halophilum]